MAWRTFVPMEVLRFKWFERTKRWEETERTPCHQSVRRRNHRDVSTISALPSTAPFVTIPSRSLSLKFRVECRVWGVGVAV